MHGYYFTNQLASSPIVHNVLYITRPWSRWPRQCRLAAPLCTQFTVLYLTPPWSRWPLVPCSQQPPLCTQCTLQYIYNLSLEQLALSAVHPVALLYVHNILYITLPFLEQVAPSAEQLVALQYCTQYTVLYITLPWSSMPSALSIQQPYCTQCTLCNPSLEQVAPSAVHPVVFQYRSRSFLRNCSKANFVKTLAMLYFEKVGIGTRFSTLPGEFNQGLQTNCTEKIDENG